MIEFIIMIFLGYFLRGMLDGRTIFNLLYYIVLPAAIILQFSSFELDINLSIFPLVYIFSTIIILHTIEFIAKKIFQLSDTMVGSILLTIPVINAGSMFAISSYFLGNEGLIKSSIYSIGYVFVIPYATIIASRYSVKMESIQELLAKSTIGSPIFISIIIGLIINIYNIEIPNKLDKILEYISYLLIPLSMISLGIGIDRTRIFDKKIFLIIFIKTIIGIALIYLISQIIVLSSNDIIILIIANLTPLGFFGPMMANRMGLDVGFTSNLVVTSVGLFTLFSIILWYVVGGG